MSRLALTPVTLRAAFAFVAEHHRHHGHPPRCSRFAVGAAADGRLVGVAIVGNPVARHLRDGLTTEVTRLCTTGHPNACSLLYGAAWRAARALGFRRLVTYTLASEDGTSLRACGWSIVGEVAARSWSRPGRPRVDKHPLTDKVRWQAGDAAPREVPR